MEEWNNYNCTNEPKSSGNYECVIVQPIEGGRFVRKFAFLYFNRNSHKWDVANTIVTHWRDLPKLPNNIFEE